jgi:hypothetical protein
MTETPNAPHARIMPSCCHMPGGAGIDPVNCHRCRVETVVVEPTPAPTYACDMPPSRMIMSLTGFDEIAIAVRFGQKIGELREDAVTAGRAMAFVHKRRLGAKDGEAYEAAMTLTMQEVVDYFAPEPPCASCGKRPHEGECAQQLLADVPDVHLLDGTVIHADGTTSSSAEGN